eukprot:GHUV01006974.1.p3 GENE.GHUV01006974.1~~GHUV01006974.1.p3  ORF type:complete len:114 (+),score=56.97 GHUV01006974.1:520-861(+)
MHSVEHSTAQTVAQRRQQYSTERTTSQTAAQRIMPHSTAQHSTDKYSRAHIAAQPAARHKQQHGASSSRKAHICSSCVKIPQQYIISKCDTSACGGTAAQQASHLSSYLSMGE